MFLWGGPPQQDMWDMKPDTPEGIRSQFNPINSVVPGIQVSDHMPLFAQHTDKTCIVRLALAPEQQSRAVGLPHDDGRQNPTLVVPRNQRNRRDFPFFGSVLSHFTPPVGDADDRHDPAADRARRRDLLGNLRGLPRAPARPIRASGRELFAGTGRSSDDAAARPGPEPLASPARALEDSRTSKTTTAIRPRARRFGRSARPKRCG